MQRPIQTIAGVLSLALALALSPGAFAADAGTVTFAAGSVSAERERSVPLAKGDTVMTDDIVVTGTASRAQLLMIDAAKIAIRPESRLEIAEYVYAGAAQPAASAVATSDDNSSVLNLVKGGFRTITGAIASEDQADYEVRTAVGVLGVRGTNFAALLCRADCDTAPGVTPGSTVPDGLYLMVTDGVIGFSNEVATLELSAGEFAYIPFDTRAPARLDGAPPVFQDDTDFRFVDDLAADGPAGSADGAALTGFDAELGTRRTPETSAPGTGAPGTGPDSSEQDADTERGTPPQDIRGIDQDGNDVDLTPGGPADRQNRTIGFSTGPLGPAAVVWSSTLDQDPSQYRLAGNNDVTGFAGGYPSRASIDIADFDLGTAAIVESGFDSVTVLRWGRWAGGAANIVLSDGSSADQELGAQSLHWVSSPEWTAPPVMPVSGSASYTLVGNTSPTDNAGNVGVLGSATFAADFTNMLVDSTLLINIANANWNAIGQGAIGAQAQLPGHLFQGTYGEVTIESPTGTTVGTGVFAGFFSTPGQSSDPAFPGGAGLTYSLRDESGTTTVSGAAAFGNP